MKLYIKLRVQSSHDAYQPKNTYHMYKQLTSTLISFSIFHYSFSYFNFLVKGERTKVKTKTGHFTTKFSYYS